MKMGLGSKLWLCKGSKHQAYILSMPVLPFGTHLGVTHYSDKLAHVQVVINCQYSIAQMCTHEDTLAHNLGKPYFDDVMSYNLLTTSIAPSSVIWGLRSLLVPAFFRTS